MSDPIRLVKKLAKSDAARSRAAANKRKREEAAAMRGESGKKRKRRKAKTGAAACKYRVRTKGLKKAKCFKKLKSAVSAAKGMVRKGKPSASVSGPVGKRKKVKVVKVCRKPASGGKPRCETKNKRRRRKGSGSSDSGVVMLPSAAGRQPGPWADQYVFGS